MTVLMLRVILALCVLPLIASAQQWKLWATGLPQGAYPRMTVAPNHNIFFGLIGSPTKLGIVFKANTGDSLGMFKEMPPSPRPTNAQNNIVALGVNRNSEPIVGVYRTDITEPWLFVFNNVTQRWDTARSDKTPTLGAQCIATSSSGVIYVGTRWTYIYKSVDDGKTFTAIDEYSDVAARYPCYYPSFLNGSNTNGSVFSLSIDRNDRVYAGTETAGVIYSDDEGTSWHPADLFACEQDANKYDTTSPMSPLSKSGNVGGIGFTRDNNVVWSGVDMWHYGWMNSLGYADMNERTTSPVEGLPNYTVQAGQQVSRIVTTANGTMFLHSGSSNGATQVGIYKSYDGKQWQYISEGVQGAESGLSQGSLAVDGNIVFMATHLGEVWVYDATITDITAEVFADGLTLAPNPTSSSVCVVPTSPGDKVEIVDIRGYVVASLFAREAKTCIDVGSIPIGIYVTRITTNGTLHSMLLGLTR